MIQYGESKEDWLELKPSAGRILSLLHVREYISYKYSKRKIPY